MLIGSCMPSSPKESISPWYVCMILLSVRTPTLNEDNRSTPLF